MVEHLKVYPSANLDPWEFPHRNVLPKSVRDENPIISRCYAFEESTQHFFVKDKEHHISDHCQGDRFCRG